MEPAAERGGSEEWTTLVSCNVENKCLENPPTENWGILGEVEQL